MNESMLIRGYGGMSPLLEPIREITFSPEEEGPRVRCPGFRAAGCLVEIPADRYLCHFCRRTARMAQEEKR
jgi:hypothetical protein